MFDMLGKEGAKKARKEMRARGYAKDVIDSEIVADSLFDVLSEKGIIKEMSKETRVSVADMLRHLSDSIREMLSRLTGTETWRIELRDKATNYRHLSNMFMNAMDTAADDVQRAELVEDIRGEKTEKRQSRKKETVTDFLKKVKSPITPQDVEVLRSIGRKSINSFSSEDIQKAAKWAYKFYNELGTKSPFFRAWFGEYRAKEKTPVKIADIPKYIASNEARKTQRGTVENSDTGWKIRISREGETNTISHAGDTRLSEKGLSGIRELVENAVLLDSEVHEHHSNSAKNDLVAFDHKLYALGKDTSGNIGLYRITIEDAYHDAKHQSEKAFHNLKYIEKVATVGGRTAEQSLPGVSTNDKIATVHSIAEIYNFVKKYDTVFNVGKSVNRIILCRAVRTKKSVNGKTLICFNRQI